MGSIPMLATVLASSSGAFSPQHKNNYNFQVEGIAGMNILQLALSRCPLPKWMVEVMRIPLGNGWVYAAGKRNFEGGSFQFRDYVDQDTQRILATWVSLVDPGILNASDGRIMTPQNYKKNGDLLMAAPDGTFLRYWQLIGVFPSGFDPGDLDQASSDQVECGITLNYDQAVYLGAQPGLQVI